MRITHNPILAVACSIEESGVSGNMDPAHRAGNTRRSARRARGQSLRVIVLRPRDKFSKEAQRTLIASIQLFRVELNGQNALVIVLQALRSVRLQPTLGYATHCISTGVGPDGRGMSIDII